ncbi:hypothetical protein [Salinirubrum litoreum]|uniref:Uncharacterized protein n=1 Tax=Salinirubrum litoreum TaxID=1126234 RepID=A0ABD5RGC1_9EURY|nr:hypothetical protein [Salinirubrum litoreum]
MSEPTDVPGRDPERLVSFLSDRLGDDFRSLVEYHPDEQVVHYVADDIDRSVAVDRLDRIRNLYEGERLACRPTSDDPSFGPLFASTHVFGGALVVHLLDEAGTAIGFSMDHGVGGRLSQFVEECLAVLYDSHPWTN